MALCELHFSSAVLKRAQTCCVILPEPIDKSREYPVLYLLHGYSDDYSIWLRRTSLERYLGGAGLIVVMPDGGHEFYVNADTGYNYETFITEELFTIIEDYFPASSSGEKRSIGGLSMGGYGAMRLGLKYPSCFASVHAHSGAFDIETRSQQTENTLEHLERVFGDTIEGTDRDIFTLIKEADPKKLPQIKFDCGFDDHCLEDNRKLDKAFKKKGISAQYDEYPGAHNWDFWDHHITDALRFHRKVLNTEGDNI